MFNVPLNGLAMMSVERAISKGIDFAEIIDQFASRKAGVQNFIKLFIKHLEMVEI